MQCPPYFMAELSSLAPEMQNMWFCLVSGGCECRVWGRKEGSTCCPGAPERAELPVFFFPSLPHRSCLLICLSALAPSCCLPLHSPHCRVYIKVMARILASWPNKKSPMERTKASLSFVLLSQRMFHISTSLSLLSREMVGHHLHNRLFLNCLQVIYNQLCTVINHTFFVLLLKLIF